MEYIIGGDVGGDVGGTIHERRSQQEKEDSARRRENDAAGKADHIASRQTRPASGKTRARSLVKQI
jgi:hypothetical protein